VGSKVSFPNFAPCFTKQNVSLFGDHVHYIALTCHQRLNNLSGLHEIRYWNSARKFIDCKLHVNSKGDCQARYLRIDVTASIYRYCCTVHFGNNLLHTNECTVTL